MEWQTGAPPVGQEVEFETDGGKTRKGVLKVSGSFGMRAGTTPPDEIKLRTQYMIEGGELEMFEVKKWRLSSL